MSRTRSASKKSEISEPVHMSEPEPLVKPKTRRAKTSEISEPEPLKSRTKDASESVALEAHVTGRSDDPYFDNEESLVEFINEHPEYFPEVRPKLGFMFIGRTTPPTRGHLSAFLKMIALRDMVGHPDIPIILNLSPSSPDNLKKVTWRKFEDPLICAQKEKYIRSMLSKFVSGSLESNNIFPICVPETSLSAFRGIQLNDIMEKKALNLDVIVVFIGQDRFDTTKYSVEKLMQNYTSITHGHPAIKVFVLKRDKTMDPTSGTKIRETILKNYEDEEKAAADLEPLYTLKGVKLLDTSELKELYQDVVSGVFTGKKNLGAEESQILAEIHDIKNPTKAKIKTKGKKDRRTGKRIRRRTRKPRFNH